MRFHLEEDREYLMWFPLQVLLVRLVSPGFFHKFWGQKRQQSPSGTVKHSQLAFSRRINYNSNKNNKVSHCSHMVLPVARYLQPIMWWYLLSPHLAETRGTYSQKVEKDNRDSFCWVTVGSEWEVEILGCVVTCQNWDTKKAASLYSFLSVWSNFFLLVFVLCIG